MRVCPVHTLVFLYGCLNKKNKHNTLLVMKLGFIYFLLLIVVITPFLLNLLHNTSHSDIVPPHPLRRSRTNREAIDIEGKVSVTSVTSVIYHTDNSDDHTVSHTSSHREVGRSTLEVDADHAYDLNMLLMKYRPVIFLNTSEKYFPLTIQEFLASSQLVRCNNKTVLKDYGDITPENIASFNTEFVAPEDLMVEIRESAHNGHDPNTLAQVPVYVHVYDHPATNSIVAQYVFLYAYNGAQRIAGMDFGAHKGDVEHVSAFIDKSTHALTHMYFAAHNTGNGRLVPRDRIKFYHGGTHPVVYSARWSHGSYEKSGRFPQGRAHTGSVVDSVSMYDDMTDDTGVHWHPNTVVVIDNTTGWNVFKGTLGGGREKGPRAPSQQKGWYGKGL